MELHKAIQQIIKDHGLSTLQEPRLLSMLNDYQAYKSNPATKFVVSSLFNEGVIALLMNYGQWNTLCDQLVHQVSKTTGFQPDLVSVVLKSFAFGLGWIKESDITAVPNNPNPPAPAPNPPVPNNPIPNPLNLGYKALSKKSDDFVSDYIEKCQDYLDSIIVIKGNWERDLGAKFRITSLYEVYSNCSDVRINFEITGGIKAKVEYHVSFNVVMYNKQGRIVNTTLGLLNKKDKNKTFFVVTSDSIDEQYFKYVGNIGKIVVYWDIL